MPQIKHRTTNTVLYKSECGALRNCVEAAVKTGANLRGANLQGANLWGASLRGAYLRGADLQNADLQNADLRGAHLRHADLQNADLQNAYLRGADLQNADLQGAHLRGADLQDAYLRGADLQNAYLRDADLRGAYLRGADLQNADFGALDIPVIERIDNAIESAIDAGGRLEMESWHGPYNEWCGTTHCRAGWAVHLAGERGKALEDEVGPHVAGLLIYRESRPGEPTPNFFASYKEAIADIRRCAARQRTGV